MGKYIIERKKEHTRSGEKLKHSILSEDLLIKESSSITVVVIGVQTSMSFETTLFQHVVM